MRNKDFWREKLTAAQMEFKLHRDNMPGFLRVSVDFDFSPKRKNFRSFWRFKNHQVYLQMVAKLRRDWKKLTRRYSNRITYLSTQLERAPEVVTPLPSRAKSRFRRDPLL